MALSQNGALVDCIHGWLLTVDRVQNLASKPPGNTIQNKLTAKAENYSYAALQKCAQPGLDLEYPQ